MLLFSQLVSFGKTSEPHDSSEASGADYISLGGSGWCKTAADNWPSDLGTTYNVASIDDCKALCSDNAYCAALGYCVASNCAKRCRQYPGPASLYVGQNGYPTVQCHIRMGPVSTPSPTPAPTPCNTYNKHKALYASFVFEPSLATSHAFDLAAEVAWNDLESLRAWGRNGIYQAFMLHWDGSAPSGYMGPQATGAGNPQKEQVLFSLWDRHPGLSSWQPALPMHKNCLRNCNDCSVHDGLFAPDGSTGTQCKIFIPAYTGQLLRIRAWRSAEGVTKDAYGASFTGDVWKVRIEDRGTGQSWIVGKQLLAGVTNRGLRAVTTFNEHIGCTPCGAFDESVTVHGPWVLSPSGTRLMEATSTYSRDPTTYTCHLHNVTAGSSPGALIMNAGPATPLSNPPTWSKSLYHCPTHSGHCAADFGSSCTFQRFKRRVIKTATQIGVRLNRDQHESNAAFLLRCKAACKQDSSCLAMESHTQKRHCQKLTYRKLKMRTRRFSHTYLKHCRSSSRVLAETEYQHIYSGSSTSFV